MSPLGNQVAPPGYGGDRASVYSRQLEKINRTTTQAIEDDAMMDTGEVKVGVGDSSLLFGTEFFKTMLKDPAIGIEIGGEASTLNTNSIELNMSMSKVRFENDKVLNPLLKQKPTTIVNYFPPVITLPPSTASGLLRGIAGVILGILEVYRAEKESGKVTTSFKLMSELGK